MKSRVASRASRACPVKLCDAKVDGNNKSEACPHEQNDYVSRDRMQNFYLRPTRRTLQGKGARALIESRIFIISLPDSMLKIKCSDSMR